MKSSDPYDYSIIILNKVAKITSVSCNVQVGYQAQKSFSKALESKLTAAGWKKQSETSYNNTTNGNTINVSGSNVTLTFNGAAATDTYEAPYGGGDSAAVKY